LLDPSEKKMDLAEKRAVRYLKRRFKTDAINVESVWPCERTSTLVEGRVQGKRGSLAFHVMVGPKGNIQGWKAHPPQTVR